jgi:uncharacterized protein (DUF486 family)
MEKLDQEKHVKIRWRKIRGKYFQNIIKTMPVIGSLITIFGIIPFILKELASLALKKYLIDNQLLEYYQDLNHYVAGVTSFDSMAWAVVYALLAIIILFLPNYLLNKFLLNNGYFSVKRLFIYVLVIAFTIISVACLLYHDQSGEWQYLLAMLCLGGLMGLFLNYLKYKNTPQPLSPIFSMFAALLMMCILVNAFFVRIGQEILHNTSFKILCVVMILLIFSNFAYSAMNAIDKIKAKISQVAMFLFAVIAFVSGVFVIILLVEGSKPYAELPRDLGIGNYYT